MEHREREKARESESESERARERERERERERKKEKERERERESITTPMPRCGRGWNLCIAQSFERTLCTCMEFIPRVRHTGSPICSL
jgi:hypothetical protein